MNFCSLAPKSNIGKLNENIFTKVSLPMKKPVTMEAPKRRHRRKDARPEEILTAGLEEFAERGFSAARLEDIASRAGIATGTIYRYFDGKEVLFEAAVKSRISPGFENLDQAMINAFPGSTTELLHHVIKRLYEKIFEPEGLILVKIVLTEGSRFPLIAELYYREIISKANNLMNMVVRRGIERGELRDGPASSRPEVLSAPAIMAVIWQMTFNRFEQVTIDMFAAAHVDLIVNGLALNPTTKPKVL